jgi:hypothetical protein|tara:strand:+ start:220 stop:528 length:309 start_codon:yes stop_codon:yes gene_type:complete
MKEEHKMEYQDYINELQNGTFDVTFTKVNGEIRNMTCTLAKDQLPQVSESIAASILLNETVAPRKVNTEAVKVWDLDAKGWRSFRIASVTNFTKIYSTERTT